MDYKELSKKYENLLNLYNLEIESKTMRSKRVLSARMSLVGVMLEIRSHELKKGKNEKTEQRTKLNSEILECLDFLGELEQENHDLKLISRMAIAEKDYYRSKVSSLENKIKEIEKFYEGK